MPFGIQTKGFVVGVVAGAVVIPRVLSILASKGK